LLEQEVEVNEKCIILKKKFIRGNCPNVDAVVKRQ
jgi:hypothetical protein